MMPVFLFAYCLAIILSQFQARLYSHGEMATCLLGLLLLYLVRKRLPLYVIFSVFAVVLGLLLVNITAQSYLAKELPPHFEQETLEFTVKLRGLAENRGQYWRSEAQILHSAAPSLALERIRLDWYNVAELKPCQVWRIQARLKRPHGLRNPNVWNARKSFLEKNIHAVGYVRQAQLISEDAHCFQNFRLRWHAFVQSRLDDSHAAWLIALSTGDKQLISTEQYAFLQRSGINHLFVISGLHIGLAAAFFYHWVLLLRRLGLGIFFPGDWRPLATLAGFVAAFFYAALADFTIPTQRSLIMLLVFFSAGLFGVRISLWRRYFLAMALVLTLNPFAAMNIGFYLSFTAVALLIICAAQIKPQQKAVKWRLAIAAQFYIALGMSPFLLLFFGAISLSSPWVNLFAISFVSLLIIPLVLLALFAWLIFSQDFYLLTLASFLLDKLFVAIESCNRYFLSLADALAFSALGFDFLLWFAACLLLFFLPRYWPAKFSALAILCAAYLLSHNATIKEVPPLQVRFLDVGQGLSVLVSTKNHQLLYDTGSSWPTGSMAQQVILPVLRHYAINALDTLIISHRDNDHAGGWPYLRENIVIKQRISNHQTQTFQTCDHDQTWQWDGVQFSLLFVPQTAKASENDRSCILLIEYAGRKILLSGDISKSVEYALLNDKPQLRNIDVLQVPHHGSKTSSSYWLVQQVQNARVIFSTGYLNRFHHPHGKVVQRYQQARATLYNTAQDGMISITIDAQGNVKDDTYRQSRRRYWDR